MTHRADFSRLPRQQVWDAMNHREGIVPWLELGINLPVMTSYFQREDLALVDVVRFHSEVGLAGIGVHHWDRFGWSVEQFADVEVWGQAGRITSRDKLADLVVPEPDEKAIRARIEPVIEAAGKYDLAVFATMMFAFDPASQDMGFENYFYAVYDDPGLVREVLDRYTRYNRRLGEIFSSIEGLDFIWVGEDIAYKNGMMFSKRYFDDELLPRYRYIVEGITKPWVFHSDGDYSVVVDDLIALGANGIHPFEVGAMDIFAYKRTHGDGLTLFGDVLVDLLARGTPEQVRQRVHQLLAHCSAGGGYVLTSGNSLTWYVKLENVLAMGQARDEYYQLG